MAKTKRVRRTLTSRKKLTRNHSLRNTNKQPKRKGPPKDKDAKPGPSTQSSTSIARFDVTLLPMNSMLTRNPIFLQMLRDVMGGLDERPAPFNEIEDEIIVISDSD